MSHILPKKVKTYLNTTYSASPLSIFRIGFGLVMCVSIVRFWLNGWIETLYINPKFHFSYYGFSWVQALGNYTYLLFLVCGISAFCVAIGFKYRWAIISFFLSFTYIELIDKTTYLNHYYFVSVLSFILCFLPANASFSIDNLLQKKQYTQIPKWTIDSLKLLLSIVYIYAGLVKLNSDWLLNALPLKIWLPFNNHVPFIGDTLLQKEWFHFVMSWLGVIYDLIIPFLLWHKKTRVVAFCLVVIFHVLTSVLFPIGMFPYIMIVATIVFFDKHFHEKIIDIIKQFIKNIGISLKPVTVKNFNLKKQNKVLPVIILFFCFQILIPWRYLLYPGELLWTEEGYRFSWRVMLIEKKGHTNFKIVNGKTGDFFYVNNGDFLTRFQEEQMSFQPDFILEYAHFLGDKFTADGHQNVEVYVDCFVSLNGRLSQRFIDPKVNLYAQTESFKHKNWILPFNDTIYGL